MGVKFLLFVSKKLLSLEHDIGGKIFLVTFLEEQKREYDMQR